MILIKVIKLVINIDRMLHFLRDLKTFSKRIVKDEDNIMSEFGNREKLTYLEQRTNYQVSDASLV